MKTNKVMSGIELLKKSMSKIGTKYKKAYKKGEQRPSVQRMKAQMKHGARP